MYMVSVRATPMNMRAAWLPIIGWLLRRSWALHFVRRMVVVRMMRDVEAGKRVRGRIIGRFVLLRAVLHFVDVKLMARRQVRAHHVEYIRRVDCVLQR